MSLDVNHIQVSIIIPTFNGALRLPTLLSRLLEIMDGTEEVIVVNDGSTDNTTDVVRSFEKRFSQLLIIHQDNKGRAGARNAGAQFAKGDFLVFYDDDIVPNAESIKLHCDTLIKYSNVISAGQQLEMISKQNEFTQFKAYLSAKWVEHLGKQRRALTFEELFLTAANMAVSKDNFIVLKGFDDTLRDTEDFDFAIRAFSARIDVIYDPSNVVYHISFDNLRSYILRQREYRESFKVLWLKRQNSEYNMLYSRIHTKTSKWKAIVYFLVPGASVTWIDKGSLLYLPKKLRIKIYIRIISALSLYYPNRSI